MSYQLRDYQQSASDAAVSFFKDQTRKRNALLVLPTGSGKSLVIADIASRIVAPVLIFQPSKEILEQNHDKLCSYGHKYPEVTIFSASAGQKKIGTITFATIGSVTNNQEAFSHFEYVIVDEAHLVNPKEGMYKRFFNTITCKILGLTATPYRLYSNSFGSELRFITRTQPKVFNELLGVCQIKALKDRGYLSELEYFTFNCISRNRLDRNTKGVDYTEKSIRSEYELMDFPCQLRHFVERLLYKSKIQRRGILVFTQFVNEAQALVDALTKGIAVIVTGETPKKEREVILNNFKNGITRVVVNVGVLTTGFDYPELDTIVLARATMSLALYYQMVGRAIRPHVDKKSGWIVDLCGNVEMFGKVEDIRIDKDGKGLPIVRNTRRQLTNVIL